MTITSSTQSPSPTGNTPTVNPVTTGTLTAIRESIQPRTGWWQFEWPTAADFRPWHYWTSITSAVICLAGVIALLVRYDAIR